MTDRGRAVLKILRDFTEAYGREKCHPGRLWLAGQIGCGVRELYDEISELEAAGYLRQIRRRRRPSLYELPPMGRTFAAPISTPIKAKNRRSRITIIRQRVAIADQEKIPDQGPLVNNYSSAKAPIKKPLMQMPSFYTEPNDIKLWKLAQRYLLEHNPDISDNPNRRIIDIMYALEAAGALSLPEGAPLPELIPIPSEAPAARKPPQREIDTLVNLDELAKLKRL